MAIQRYQYETSPRKLEEIYRQEKPKVPKKNVAPRKKTVSKTEIIHKSNRTKIIISFKSKYQTPLFMIVREYYDKRTNEVTYAEILFEIE